VRSNTLAAAALLLCCHTIAFFPEKFTSCACNEFGAFRETADPASRGRWIADVRSALEENHIGWTMWDYRGNFGVVQRTAQIRPDSAIMLVLGLNANVQPVALNAP
jgi:hypothetical protein